MIDIVEQLVVSCSPISSSVRHSGYGGKNLLFEILKLSKWGEYQQKNSFSNEFHN